MLSIQINHRDKLLYAGLDTYKHLSSKGSRKIFEKPYKSNMNQAHTSLRIFLSPLPLGLSSSAISHRGISNKVLMTSSSRKGNLACNIKWVCLNANYESSKVIDEMSSTSFPLSEMHLSSLPIFLFQILCISNLISSWSAIQLKENQKKKKNQSKSQGYLN